MQSLSLEEQLARTKRQLAEEVQRRHNLMGRLLEVLEHNKVLRAALNRQEIDRLRLECPSTGEFSQ